MFSGDRVGVGHSLSSGTMGFHGSGFGGAQHQFREEFSRRFQTSVSVHWRDRYRVFGLSAVMLQAARILAFITSSVSARGLARFRSRGA
jgi:hypothetical protein